MSIKGFVPGMMVLAAIQRTPYSKNDRDALFQLKQALRRFIVGLEEIARLAAAIA